MNRGGVAAFPGRVGASARRIEYLAATGRRLRRPRGELTCMEIKFQAPHAIDATLSPANSFVDFHLGANVGFVFSSASS